MAALCEADRRRNLLLEIPLRVVSQIPRDRQTQSAADVEENAMTPFSRPRLKARLFKITNEFSNRLRHPRTRRPGETNHRFAALSNFEVEPNFKGVHHAEAGRR